MATDLKRPNAEAQTDPRVLHPLRQLRARIRTYVGVEGALTVALFLSLWFWVGLLLDYGVFKLFTFDWVQEAPRDVRKSALFLGLTALAALVLTRVVIRVVKDFSPRALALVLERRFPDVLGDRLITAVELADVKRQEQYGYSADMIRKTIADARERVGQVPVNRVFNWRRLRVQGAFFAAATLGVFLLVGGALALTHGLAPRAYASGFGDVAGIWFERNVLLRNTTWPRNAYLEVIDFPPPPARPGSEWRVGRDQPPPRVRVQAYKWVWADGDAPEGWRPLTWADLGTALPGYSVPPIPVAALQRVQAESDVGGRVDAWLTAFPFAPTSSSERQAVTLPADLAALPDDPSLWKVDRVEWLLKEDRAVRDYLAEVIGAEGIQAFESLFEALEKRAADPSMSRTLRELKVPEEVRLSYRGQKTSVDMNLRQEAGNEYAGTLSDLKESVEFRVRGEDYVTPARQITLVPVPTVIDLRRTELRPAYLYHRPPLDPERKPIPYAPEKLKGLRQVVADMPVSLTGDRSRFEIPAGTDVFLSATVDKDLDKAWLVARPGKFPGLDPDGEVQKAELAIDADRRTVHPLFTAEAGNAIARPTEFEIEFLDTDGVTSRRVIQIQPTEDRGPEVEVVVEVIRKVGSSYLCTPKALIPFAKESRVTDRGGGLNRIEYLFAYTQLESVTDVSSKAAVIGLFFHNTPVLPSPSAGFYRAGMVSSFAPSLRSGKGTVEQSVPVETFAERYREPGFLTIERLLPKLKEPVPSADENPMITSFEFGPAGEQGFDLATVLPGLLVKDPNTPQPHYLLTLNVTATDSNVETGPKTATNKEPLVFKIVSEAEVLSEISREESDLGAKLDEVLRRLADADRVLSEILTRIPSLSGPDDYTPEQTRSQQILEGTTKARDITTEVATAYARILAEYKTNRFTPTLTDRLSSKIVNPLDSALKEEFPRWEEAHAALNTRLNQSMPPDPGVQENARQRMAELLARMRQIRAEIGEIIGYQKLIAQAQEILKAVTQQVGPGIANLMRQKQDELFAPALRAPELVSLNANQKATLTVELDWLAPLESPYSLQVVAPAASGLKVPGRADVKGSPATVAIEITAGSAVGEWEVQVVPSIGKTVTIKVSVK